MPEALPSRPRLEPIISAIIDGLEFRESDLTDTAKRALEKAALEFAKTEGLDLQVLRLSRKLWTEMGELRPPYVHLLPAAYPEMARLYRRALERRQRAEAERAERLAMYEDATQ